MVCSRSGVPATAVARVRRMERVVAIDAGTSGVRAVVVDASGAVVDLAYRELTTYFPRPGWVEHDAEEIWALVRETLAEVAGRSPGARPAAVGITNQRETVVAFDRRTGHPLHRAIVWQDRRTARRCDALRAAGHLAEVRARTGLVLDPYFSATKMSWLLEDGGVSAGSGDLALGTVDSWLLWKLTGGPRGGLFATDVTNASRTLLYDIDGGAWSEELCQLFGVPGRALAEVRPSCGRLGTLAGAVTGDRSWDGVPVSGVAGDQHAALFGQACFAPGTAKATYGTGSFVLSNAGPIRPPTVDGLLTTIAWDLGDHGGPAGGRPKSGGVVYALEGSALSSGAAIQWLRDGLGILDRADELGPLAESVQDSGGAAVIPAFTGMGSPWWDPRARGAITGITRGTGRAQLARAVVEALAYQVRAIVDAMTAAGTAVAELRVDGGASAVDLLLRIQADQLGVPVARPRSVESTALGAAGLSGLAEGVWTSTDELGARWRLDADFFPGEDRGAADARYTTWRAAAERALNWATE